MSELVGNIIRDHPPSLVVRVCLPLPLSSVGFFFFHSTYLLLGGPLAHVWIVVQKCCAYQELPGVGIVTGLWQRPFIVTNRIDEYCHQSVVAVPLSTIIFHCVF